jgi:hypothetical protein
MLARRRGVSVVWEETPSKTPRKPYMVRHTGGIMNFEFDEDGFLTDRRSLLEAAIRRQSESLFARAHCINRECHHLLFAAEPHDRDMRELLVTVSVMRALEHYQATVLLLSSGMIAPARAALRDTLEAVFTVCALTKNDEAVKAFIADDLLQRRKLVNKAKQHDYTNLQVLRGAITEELVQSIDAQIKEREATALHTERLAQLAGMHDWYTTLYAILSKTTHTHVRDLECYLILDDDGKMRHLEYAPSMDEVPDLLLITMECILRGADALAQTFGLPFETKSNHLKFIEIEVAQRQ